MAKSAEILRKNLKKRLDQIGWTPLRLSQETGIPNPSVYNHLNGKVTPGLEILEKYAVAMGTTPADLLGGVTPPPQTEALLATITAQQERIRSLEGKLKALQEGLAGSNQRKDGEGPSEEGQGNKVPIEAPFKTVHRSGVSPSQEHPPTGTELVQDADKRKVELDHALSSEMKPSGFTEAQPTGALPPALAARIAGLTDEERAALWQDVAEMISDIEVERGETRKSTKRKV